MPASPSSLLTAVLGASPRMRRHVEGVLLSTSTYLLYACITAVQVAFGFIDGSTAAALVAFGMAMNAVFYAVVRSGRVLGGRDPGLPRTQLLAGMLFMFVGYAVSGRSAAAVPIVMASHIVYAMFTMPARQVWRLVVASLLGLAVTMAVCVRYWPERFAFDMQVVSFLYVALVIPLIAMLAHRLTALTERLREQQQELQAAMHRLEALATRDDLTGTHNRRHMTALMSTEHERQRRDGHAVCIALLDIDLFKQINDRHGHAAGDEVLRRFAQLTQESLRNVDMLARWGGEEFLVMLPGVSSEQAAAVLERVRQRVTQGSFADLGPGLAVNFSAGVAALEPERTPLDAVERADQAMYRAKTGGRSRTELDLAPATS